MTDWHQVSTCPLNEYVLLWCDGFVIIGYQFAPGKFSQRQERKRHEIFHVTHWATLPEGPEQ